MRGRAGSMEHKKSSATESVSQSMHPGFEREMGETFPFCCSFLGCSGASTCCTAQTLGSSADLLQCRKPSRRPSTWVSAHAVWALTFLPRAPLIMPDLSSLSSICRVEESRCRARTFLTDCTSTSNLPLHSPHLDLLIPPHHLSHHLHPHPPSLINHNGGR